MDYDNYVGRYVAGTPELVPFVPQSVLSWIEWRNRQRLAFPDNPFFDGTLRLLSIPSSWESASALLSVLSDNSFTFTGVKQLPRDTHFLDNAPSLYADEYIGDTIILHEDYMVGDGGQYVPGWEVDNTVSLVWEFIGSKGKDILYPYVYIPVREDYVPLLRENNFLPTIPWWGNQSRGYDWPSKLYVVDVPMDRWEEWYTFTAPRNLLTHPFIPTMAATGRCTLQGDGTIIYEYREIQGTYARKGALFMSSLQPKNLAWPLGLPREWDKDDRCYEVGNYPAWGAEWHLGGYTGYKTTKNYHPWVTYYLYESPGGRAFLHDAPPERLGRRNASYVFGMEGLVLSVDSARNRFVATSQNCGLALELVDDSYLPCGYDYDYFDYLGDCTHFDDDLWLGYRGSYRSNYIDDDFPLEDGVMLSDEWCLESNLEEI